MFPFQRQTSTYAKEFRHPKIIGRFLLEHTGRPIDNLPWVNTKQVATDDLIACLRTLKGKNLSIRELVEFINPRDHEKVHQTYRRLTHTQTIAHFDRYFAWNFNNLIFDKDGKRTDTALGSVEFRRPAGSVKPSDALTWVEFIVGFTLAAFDHGDIETLKTYPRERVFPKEHSKDEVYYASSLASLKAFIQAPKKVPRPGTDIVFADQPGFKNPTGYLDRILSGPVAIPRAPTKEELEFMKLWEDWAGQRNHEDNFVSAIEFLCVDDVSLPTRPENAIL